MTKQKYGNRQFVWLQSASVFDCYAHEHELCKNYFAFRSFTYYECIDFLQKVIRMRPGYLNGKDWSRLEAGHRFKSLLVLGVIRELK